MPAPAKPLKIVCATSVTGGLPAFSTLGQTVMIPEAEITPLAIRDADVLVTRSKVKINESFLTHSHLSFYGTATAGFDHVDISALQKRNIAWSQAPGCNANSVAEYVIAALSWIGVRSQVDWTGKTIGIIGAGHVGSRLAEVAGIFGLNVILNDPPLRDATGDKRYRNLDEVLEKADIVSLHVPLVHDGRHPTIGMADQAFFAAMKPGSIFINASRGEVVVESDLREAADHGVFFAVVLDVFDHEPDINISTLKVATLATPHIAGYSLDGRLKGTEIVYQAACRHFGVNPTWQPPPISEPTMLGAMPAQPDRRTLYEIILSAYNPGDDDHRLRSLPVGSRMHKHFQELRQNYAERGEFFRFAVSNANGASDTADRLNKLGFQVLPSA